MSGKKRMNPREKAKANPQSKRNAINAKCFDCSYDQYREVTLCTSPGCPLWPVRPWQNKEA